MTSIVAPADVPQAFTAATMMASTNATGWELSGVGVRAGGAGELASGRADQERV